MNVQEMIEFLVLCRDKVDIEINKVSINAPLIEISAMLTAKINELQAEVFRNSKLNPENA